MNFHKHTNSHLHRDESRCKWAKRCVLELSPWAAQRDEQETPRGKSKSVKHVSHFISSRNDGFDPNAKTKNTIYSVAFAFGFTRQGHCCWISKRIHNIQTRALACDVSPSKVILCQCAFWVQLSCIGKKKARLRLSLNVYFVKRGYESTKANTLHEIKYSLWHSAEYTAVW